MVRFRETRENDAVRLRTIAEGYFDQVLVNLIVDYRITNMTNKTHFILKKQREMDYNIGRNAVGNQKLIVDYGCFPIA